MTEENKQNKEQNEFAEQMFNQDAPDPIRQSQQNIDILKKIKHRMKLQKISMIAFFLFVYLVAFVMFMIRGRVRNDVYAVSLGLMSLHIVLWYSVYCLSQITKHINDILDKTQEVNDVKPTKSINGFMVILVSILFILSSFFICQGFFFSNPVKVAIESTGWLLAAVFIQFIYVLKIGALLSKLWFEYKKLEIKQNDS